MRREKVRNGHLRGGVDAAGTPCTAGDAVSWDLLIIMSPWPSLSPWERPAESVEPCFGGGGRSRLADTAKLYGIARWSAGIGREAGVNCSGLLYDVPADVLRAACCVPCVLCVLDAALDLLGPLSLAAGRCCPLAGQLLPRLQRCAGRSCLFGKPPRDWAGTSSSPQHRRREGARAGQADQAGLGGQD